VISIDYNFCTPDIISSGVVHIKARPVPHCRVLPPGIFNGKIPNPPFPVLCGHYLLDLKGLLGRVFVAQNRRQNEPFECDLPKFEEME